ncbi:MAG: Cysteine desulfurase IscS [Verrucomicrobia subdivision 3 bacterium]|nr:Cysteine desulfurase IscS [Limisphaerales bacterium]MCS1415961.1 Cysteine desulfurase IscS [Limisphaerales bacterium]
MKIDKTIYLDHQATTPLDQHVLAKMAPYYGDLFGNPHSSDHSLGWESARAIEEATAQVAQLIGADPDEIIFTSGATESNNMALLGLGRRAAGGSRHRVLVSAIEHKCVLASARVLQEQHEFTIERIPVDRQGRVELSALDNMLNEDVLAVSVMAVNNEIGTIQDIEKISDYAHRYGAIFHCDAAQAPLAMPIDAIATQVDILSLSGHKMYGPKGIGIIFIARDQQDQIEPLIYGGGQQNGLRCGTLPVPLCVGMGAAAELLIGEDAGEKREDLHHRRDVFVRRLREMDWPISLIGPEGEARHPGNANICFLGLSAHEILGTLQPRLAASTGSACTSGLPEPSHVLRAIGLDSDDAEACVRFSLGFGTTDEDVERSIGLIEEVLAKLSKTELACST